MDTRTIPRKKAGEINVRKPITLIRGGTDRRTRWRCAGVFKFYGPCLRDSVSTAIGLLAFIVRQCLMRAHTSLLEPGPPEGKLGSLGFLASFSHILDSATHDSSSLFASGTRIIERKSYGVRRRKTEGRSILPFIHPIQIQCP